MKKSIKSLIALSLLVLGSLGTLNSEDTRSLTTLQGYTLVTNPGPQKDFNLWVITNEQAFNQEFITGAENAARPNFDSQLVVAASAETRDNKYHVSFTKSTVSGNSLNIYFHVIKASKKQVETNVSLAAVSRDAAVKKVNFFHDNILVRTVPLVNVY